MYKKFKPYDEDPKNNLTTSHNFSITKILKNGSTLYFYTTKLTEKDLKNSSYSIVKEFDDEFEQSSTLYLKQFNKYLCKTTHQLNFSLIKIKGIHGHGLSLSSCKTGETGDLVELNYPLHVIKTMTSYNQYDMELVNGDHLIYSDMDGLLTFKYNNKVIFEEKDLSDIDKLKEENGKIIKICVCGKQGNIHPDITLFKDKIIKDDFVVLTMPVQIHYFCPEKIKEEVISEFRKQGFTKGSCGCDW